jgi:hypothetical protein
MRNIVHFVLLILVAFALACSMPASAAAQGPFSSFFRTAEGQFTRTLNVSGIPDLDVSTGSGSISIRNGPSNLVEIRGKIRAGDGWWRSSRDAEDLVRRIEANPPIEQSGQTIRIGRMPDSDWQRNVSISYDIIVPAQSNVRSNTGSGSQNLEGITGRVETRTGSGSITLRDIRGDLDANTGSGSIQGNGVRAGALRMHTGSGSIRVQGEQSGRWDLQTGSGGIDLDLPPDAGFDLSAHTGSGGVDVGFQMTVQGNISRDRHDVSGKVGSGRYPLYARTGSGHVRIQ